MTVDSYRRTTLNTASQGHVPTLHRTKGYQMGRSGAETMDKGLLSRSLAISRVAVFWFGLEYFDLTIYSGTDLANGFISLPVRLFSP